VCELDEELSMQGTQTVDARPAADAPGQTAAEARLQRNLKFVVVALGVLIFAGLATAAGRIIYLASVKPAQPASSSMTLAPAAGLQLPAGARCAPSLCRATGWPFTTWRAGRRVSP
jgi:hypothetical protein